VGIGINVGAILVGSSVGAFGAGRLSDRIGRRGVMKLSAVLFLISALIAGAAGSSLVFILARIIGGLASVRPASFRRSISPKSCPPMCAAACPACSR
jgi:MFS family permease